MIDFRYHLVSIVSIFLALAVGIALGAGPLKGTISEGISSEITTLRKDKADLNAQLKAAEVSSARRDAFIASGNKLLLASRLSGDVVDLVVLPGGDSALLKATANTLLAAGAKVGATVRVESAWTDPTKATDQTALADELATELGLDRASDGSIPLLARVLARTLQPAATGEPDAATVADVLAKLEAAQLVSVDEDKPTPASLVVIVASPVDTGSTATDATTAEAYAAMAGAFDRAGVGTVVASNTGVATNPTGTSVVQAVRDNSVLGRGVSTVDDTSLPMGQASIVYALIEQGEGGSGHYGLGDGTTAPYPAIVGS